MNKKSRDKIEKFTSELESTKSIDRISVIIEKKYQHNMLCIKEFLTLIYLPIQILLWSSSKYAWYLLPAIILSTVTFGIVLKILNNFIFYSNIKIEIYEKRLQYVKQYKDDIENTL